MIFLKAISLNLIWNLIIFFYIELISMNFFNNLSITEMVRSVTKMHKNMDVIRILNIYI